MLVSKLRCKACGYTSDIFGESKDLIDESYDLIFQDSENRNISVRKVPEKQLGLLGIDLDASSSRDIVQARLANENEVYIELPLGNSGSYVDAKCPECEAVSLEKVICTLS